MQDFLSSNSLNEEPAKNHLISGQEALKNQDFGKAIVEFKKVLRDNPSQYQTYFYLGQAYEKKASFDNENAFYKMAWNAYITVLKNNIIDNKVIDGLTRIAYKLLRFDELVEILKEIKIRNPENPVIEASLKKVTAISFLSIPSVDHEKSKESSLFIKLLIDVGFPSTGIFLILLGHLIPRYAAQSKLKPFAPIFVCTGFILFLSYIAIKLLKTPQKKHRKNW